MNALLVAVVALKDVFAPVVVGVPPTFAVRDLCVTADGEIRHYGKALVGGEVTRVYLASRDNGLSWTEHVAESNDVGALVRSPWSGECIGFTGARPVTLVRSKKGPGDTQAERTAMPWEGLEQRQLLPLRSRRRWLAAFSDVTCRTGSCYHAATAYSDDDGRTWTRTDLKPVADVARLAPGDLKPHWFNNGCEPTIAELADGTILLCARTSGPHAAFYRSTDGGETWSEGKPDPAFWQANTMPYLFRLKDGRLLFIWNNTAMLPTRDLSEYPELGKGERIGRSETVFTNRDALHAAISDDDGRTWRGFREIFLNEIRNACDFRELGNFPWEEHDKSVHQTQALELPGGKVLLALGQNVAARRLLVFDPDWLLETTRRDDFSRGLGGLSNHLYVRSMSGCWRGWAGHCAWNRIAGATLVRDPYTDSPPAGEERSVRDVLQLCRIRDPRLVSDRQGVVWNFPAARKGRVTLDCRIAGAGFRLTLADHWMNPCDETGPSLSPISLPVDLSELRAPGWHKLTVAWDCEAGTAVLSADGKAVDTVSLKAVPRFGLSYLHLQTLAEDMDAQGSYFRGFDAAAETVSAYARDLSRARIVAPDGVGTEAVAELKAHLAAKAGTVFDDAAPLSFVFAKPDDAPAARPFESRYRIDGDTVWFWGDDGGPDEIWDWGDDRGRESQRRRGTQFAVERFARERLGLDWVWPGPDGTVVKPATRVVWPARADGAFETALEKGRIRNYEAYTPYTRKDVAGLMPEGLYTEESAYPVTYQDRWTWQRRHCLQDRSFFTYGHAFTDWYARFSKTHPEYLNWHAADGTRGWTGSAPGKRGVKLCVSNPAVADQVVADWLRAGTNRYFNVCENDGTYWCECEACRALDVPESSAEDVCANKVQLSDRYVTFWNRIAEKARAIRPDVQLVSYVYSAYRFPPRRARFAYPENFVCGFVSNVQEDAAAMVRAWQAAGMRRFFFRPNHLHYMGTIHRGYERQFYREFHDLLRLGMIGCDYDAGVNRATIAIEFYVLARTIADPSLGFEEIVRDYYAAYGAAADDVRAYYEAVRATGEAAREAAMRAKRDQGEFFDQERADVPKTQEFGRDEKELTAKKAMLDAAVVRHAAAKDLADVEMRRLRNLALQAEHGLLTYRFLVAVTDRPLDELKARAKALNDFRVAHKDDLPDLYTKIYRIWWGEVRYWKVYNRRVAQGK